MYSVHKNTWAEYIIFGITWSWFDPTIYRTQDEHASHYNTNVVRKNLKSVHVVRGVKCWLNGHRLIIIELLINTWMVDVFLIINHTYKPSGLNNSRRSHLQKITWAENTNDARCNLRPVMSKRLCLHVGIIMFMWIRIL